MGRSSPRVRVRMGTWLALIVLSGCASPMPVESSLRVQSRAAPTPTRTMRAVTRAKTPEAARLVALHGRLTSRTTKLAFDPDKPVFVVDITDPHGMESGRRHKPGVLRRTQSGFAPDLCVVPVGSRVRFDNQDKIFHTFFSSTKGNEFDLAPLDPGNSAFIRFQQAGMVHVYCSQHSGHRASILVLPSEKFARVDTTGEFHFAGLERGRHVLQIWGHGIQGQEIDVFVNGREESVLEFPVEAIPAKAGR